MQKFTKPRMETIVREIESHFGRDLRHKSDKELLRFRGFGYATLVYFRETRGRGDDINLKFEPKDVPDGVVAFFRMPLKLTAMEVMGKFVEAAYGTTCVCDEQPKGWLRVRA